jgi:hypothetical protein
MSIDTPQGSLKRQKHFLGAFKLVSSFFSTANTHVHKKKTALKHICKKITGACTRAARNAALLSLRQRLRRRTPVDKARVSCEPCKNSFTKIRSNKHWSEGNFRKVHDTTVADVPLLETSTNTLTSFKRMGHTWLCLKRMINKVVS